MQIYSHEIHLWSASLIISDEQEIECLRLLNDIEIMRVNRFHFDLHRKRFIAAHGILRKILSLYLPTLPEDILFGYTDHHKPFLKQNNTLKFNISHSHDLAVFALTNEFEIGIDIEKIEDKDVMAIAKRFFSDEENNFLNSLPKLLQKTAFFRIWSRKEALLKATGIGLHIPLDTFSVASSKTITLQNQTWSLISLTTHPEYAIAVASNQVVEKIIEKSFSFAQDR